MGAPWSRSFRLGHGLPRQALTGCVWSGLGLAVRVSFAAFSRSSGEGCRRARDLLRLVVARWFTSATALATRLKAVAACSEA